MVTGAIRNPPYERPSLDATGRKLNFFPGTNEGMRRRESICLQNAFVFVLESESRPLRVPGKRPEPQFKQRFCFCC